MAMDWRAFTNRPMVIEKVNPIIGRTKEKYSAFFPESPFWWWEQYVRSIPPL